MLFYFLDDFFFIRLLLEEFDLGVWAVTDGTIEDLKAGAVLDLFFRPILTIDPEDRSPETLADRPDSWLEVNLRLPFWGPRGGRPLNISCFGAPIINELFPVISVLAAEVPLFNRALRVINSKMRTT